MSDVLLWVFGILACWVAFRLIRFEVKERIER